MPQLVTIQVPHEWIKGIPDEELTLKEVFRIGVQEYKVKRAIQLENDSEVDIPFADGQIIINPNCKPNLTLEELFIGLNKDNIHCEVDTGLPIGNEC